MHEKLQVPTFDGSMRGDDPKREILIYGGLFMATIFGGTHAIAWVFDFPTNQEQVLWHASTAAIILVPWLGLLLSPLFDIMPGELRKYLLSMPLLLYIPGRLILLILMFTTLRNLPSDAYRVVSWTSLVLHL
ncbi:hypothetical protein AZE42_13156 [Rhizopogon vesiculosus]|uniref:Uncharacterized protein n=1 Tax=Rhizopogon vesiculosus TaxID=180088 RepID=A0A1J8R272_9AGAM|nr:hypothetical protein AZE42_13156 [Rhizopogon vesiculosus]